MHGGAITCASIKAKHHYTVHNHNIFICNDNDTAQLQNNTQK